MWLVTTIRLKRKRKPVKIAQRTSPLAIIVMGKGCSSSLANRVAVSVAVGIVAPIAAFLGEYAKVGYGKALRQQLQHFSATQSDVDQLFVSVAAQVRRGFPISGLPLNSRRVFVQIGLAVLCFVAAPWLKATATAWNRQTFARRISVPAKLGDDVTSPARSQPDDADDVTDEDLLRRMDYFQAAFPRLTRFRIVFGLAGVLTLGSGVYSLTKLTFIFSSSDSGARWALVLVTIAVNWVQWGWVSQYLRDCDDYAVEACRALPSSSFAPSHDEEAIGNALILPLLSPKAATIQEDGEFSFASKSHGELVSARRLTRKLEEARKKRKDERERNVNAKKAAANMLRIVSLSTPDVGLLTAGFISLVLAALSSALIPRFTGAVVDKVVHNSGDKQGFHDEILWLLFSGLGSGVFGGLRGGILLVALARLKVRRSFELPKPAASLWCVCARSEYGTCCSQQSRSRR